jgi:PhzF family phenazine biosynthesis protein
MLFKYMETAASVLEFHTQSRVLSVEQKGEMLWMDFPSRPAVPASKHESIGKAFGLDEYEYEVHKSADLLVVLDSEETVRQAKPDFEALKRVKAGQDTPADYFGVIITAPGRDCDFVSRYFAPNAGIDEDPVTGRAHCILIPYWSKRLGKKSMTARQLSKRGGRLWCEDAGDRVKIGGKATLYMSGEIISNAI